MKILIIDTYYEGFLKKIYSDNKSLKFASYKIQKDVLINECFGTSNFYSRNLIDNGIKAEDLIVNCYPLQSKWARENNVKFMRINMDLHPRLYSLPLVGSLFSKLPRTLDILIEQIKHFKPDIIYSQNISLFNHEKLMLLKKYSKLLVGQIACPLPSEDYIKGYDLILTSFPHFLEKLRNIGVNTEYFKIGFDPKVLSLVKNQKRDINFSFVGSISRHHSNAIPLIEYLIVNNKLKVFGTGSEKLDKNSILRKYHNGEKWGLEMYEILSRSLITLNRHINVSENYANNMRLFEATGMGSLLLTDYKDNLNEIFEIDKEIISYRSKEEASDKATYYSKNRSQAERIAKAGQLKTLENHTYQKRMIELIKILKRYL